MNEYITRAAAVAVLYYNCDEKCSAVVPDMETIPLEDVAPVVHGKWNEIVPNIELNGSVSYYACSVCGHPSSFFFWKDKYCPNCGAKMDLDGGQE